MQLIEAVGTNTQIELTLKFQLKQQVMGKKTRSGHADNLGAPEAIAAHYAQLHSQQGERRRRGSSANTSRVNPDAERFAIKARIFKKAKQSKQAYELYTKAIGLDPYNHYYFHHRAETCFNAKHFELGMWDAQFGLDLCQDNIERYKRDECFALLWCTLTRCCIELGQFDKAEKYCGTGIMVIDENNSIADFALNILHNYNNEIQDVLRSTSWIDYERVMIKPVRNEGNRLGFVYSVKLASTESPPRDAAPDQPEFLCVDDDGAMPTSELYDYIFNKKIVEWSSDPGSLERDDGSAFKVYPWHKELQLGTNYWATIMLVRDVNARNTIQSHLMCDCLKDSKIVILKLEESKECPTVDIPAYVASIVRNASQCEEMYDRGQKLAMDTHEVSPRRTSGGDLAKKGHQWWLPIIFVVVAVIMYYCSN